MINKIGLIFSFPLFMLAGCGGATGSSGSITCPELISFDAAEKVDYLITDSNGKNNTVSITLDADLKTINYTTNGTTEKIDMSGSNTSCPGAGLTGFKQLFLTTHLTAIELNSNTSLVTDYTIFLDCGKIDVLNAAGTFPAFDCYYDNNKNTSQVNLVLFRGGDMGPARGVIIYEWRDGAQFVRAELTQWNDL